MFTFVIWSAASQTGQSFSAKHTRLSSLVAGLRALKFPRLQKATMALSHMTLQWLNGEGFFVEASKKIGNSFTVVDDKVQRPALEEAGFVNIHEWEFKVAYKNVLLRN